MDDFSKSPSIWAVITDGEGLAGIATAEGWLPLVTINERNLPALREAMTTLAASNPSKTLRLVRFSDRTDCNVVRRGMPA